VLEVTRPLLMAARQAEDPASMNLFAGQAHALARELPAGQIVEEITAEALAALAALLARARQWRE
jgi:NAD(P)H-dependent flavin oxidoreductase YrpB (nitropropane dioxygenase family)